MTKRNCINCRYCSSLWEERHGYCHLYNKEVRICDLCDDWLPKTLKENCQSHIRPMKLSDEKRINILKGHVGKTGNHVVIHKGGEMSIFSDLNEDSRDKIYDLWDCLFRGEGFDLSHEETDSRTYRLRKDMESLGHNWVMTTERSDALMITLPKLRHPRRKQIRKGREHSNEVYVTEDFVFDVGDKDDYEHHILAGLRRYFLSNLEELGFNIHFEVDHPVRDCGIYIEGRHIDTEGNIRMPHPRVVIASSGYYISHPLCCRCGEHSGECLAYPDYDKAVRWADFDSYIHCGCMTEEEMERHEEKMMECEGLDEDDDTGYSVSCPLDR